MTTTSNTTARRNRFNPIFVAKVTPGSVTTRMGKNGKYAYMPDSKIEIGGKVIKRTAMAFGSGREEVASKLRKGRGIELAIQYDEGTVRVIGFPRAKNEAEAKAVNG